MKTLLIVESPAKSKTIEKLLGPNYIVLASFGLPIHHDAAAFWKVKHDKLGKSMLEINSDKFLQCSSAIEAYV
jgi:DNA topoisomerase IA